MTSDAKIGLLLGLVFIFVIAFIINGLPLRPQASEAKVATDLMEEIQQAPVGVDGSTRLAQEQLETQEETVLEPSHSNLFESSSDLPPALVQGPEAPEEATESAEDVRFAIQLPSRETVQDVTRGVRNIISALAQTSPNTLAEEAETAPAPVVEAEAARRPDSPAGRPDPQAATRTTTQGVAAVPRAYVVVDGDNLAVIAKKVYGPEEGNRMVNVKRLFEANSKLLASPDEVKIGQKLVIPRPAPPLPATVLPAEHFEQVRTASRRQVQAVASVQPEGRWYVVQEGDSLWRIAEMHLGNGVRHEEIAKLNTDILKDPTALKIGLRLRLPAK
jgi:nucleoid-associated protein YgaU